MKLGTQNTSALEFLNAAGGLTGFSLKGAFVRNKVAVGEQATARKPTRASALSVFSLLSIYPLNYS